MGPWAALVALGSALLLASVWPSWLGVPGVLRAAVGFSAVFLAPGLLLLPLVLPGEEAAGNMERLSYAFAFSLALAGIPAFVVMFLHGSVAAYTAVFAGLVATLVLLDLSRRVAGITTGAAALRFDGWGNAVLAGLVLVAALSLFPLSSHGGVQGRVDGDLLAMMALVRDVMDADRIGVEEPLFGAGLSASPRTAFNPWLLLTGFAARLGGLDPVAFVHGYFTPLLGVVSLFALYTLLRHLSGNRRLALFLVLVHFVILLANPFHRNIWSYMLFRRIASDKFAMLLIPLPVGMTFAARWLRGGGPRQIACAALVGLGMAVVHPLDVLFFAVGTMSFAGIHWLWEREKLKNLARAAALAVVVAATMVVPLFQRQTTQETREGYLFPETFVDLPVVSGPAPVLPYVWTETLKMPGARPSVLDSTMGDENPFMLTRLWSQLNSRKLLILADDRYMAHPGLLLDVVPVLALAMVPLLPLFRRDHLARYLLAITLAYLVLGFSPLITPLVGRAVTPWQVNRMAWPLPVTLIPGYVVYRGAAALFGRLPGRWATLARQAGPSLFLAGLSLVLLPLLRAYSQELLTDKVRIDAPTLIFDYLRGAPDRDSVLIADYATNLIVPAYVGKPDLVAYRATNTSEEFPAERQDEALQRIRDLDTFNRAEKLDAQVVDILRRYPVRYVLLPDDHPLSCQFRHAGEPYTEVARDDRYRLFRVESPPEEHGAIAANTLLESRDWEGAELAYTRALEADPEDRLALMGLAETWQIRNRPTEAVALLEPVIRGKADECLCAAAALAYEADARPGEALLAWQRAVAEAPQVSYLRLRLGDAYLFAGRLGEAAAAYEAAVGLVHRPGSSAYYLTVGKLWQSRRIHDRAGEAFKKAVEAAPTAANWSTLGGNLMARHRYDEAVAAFRQAARLAPWRTDLWVKLAEALRLDQGPDAAESAYQRAILVADLKAEPAQPVYLALSMLYEEGGHPEEAEATIEAAIARDPEETAGYLFLALYHRRHLRYEEALSAARRAVERAPFRAEGYLMLAGLYEDRGQTEEAGSYYRLALEVEPGSAAAWYAMGNLLSRQASWVEAIGAYRQALELEPENAFTYLALAQAHYELGHPTASLSAFQAAQRYAPRSSQTNIALGRAYELLGDRQQAIGYYQQAVTVRPDFIGGYRSLAQAYAAMGRQADALAQYQLALSLGTAGGQGGGLALGPASIAGRLQALSGEALVAASGDGPDDGQRDTAMLARQRLQSLLPSGAYEAGRVALAQVYEARGLYDEALDQYLLVAEADPTSSTALAFLADAYYRRAQFEAAADTYTRAIELDPSSTAARVGLGRALSALGRPLEGLEQLQQAARRNLGDSQAQVALAEGYRSLGRPEDALNVLREALSRSPGNLDLNLALSRTYANLGRPAEAEEAARRAVALAPGWADAAVALGDALRLQGRMGEALEAYSRATDLNRGNPEAWLRLGDLLRSQGQTGQALDAYRAAAVADPFGLAGLVPQAEMYLLIGDPESAEGLLREAMSRNAGESSAYLALHELLRLQGRDDRAAAILDLADGIRPQLDVLLARARMLKEAGQWDRELAVLEGATERFPGFAEGWVALAEAQERRGDYQAARNAYERALSVAPSDLKARLGLGGLLEREGRPLEALLQYSQAAQLNPSQPEAHAAVAAALARLGDRVQANETVRTAVTANPGSAAVRVAVGDHLLAAGNPQQAVAEYEAALALEPGYLPAHLSLSRAWLAGGQLGEAEAAARRLLELYPGSAEAQVALAAVQRAAEHAPEAVATLTQALTAHSGSSEVALALGQALFEAGEVEAAEEAFRAVTLARPGVASAWLALGNVWLTERGPAWAITAYRQGLHASPGDPELLLALGKAQTDLGLLDQAEDTFRRAVALHRHLAAPEVALGDLLLRRLDFDGAARAYWRAVSAAPSDASGWLRIGQLRLRLGRPEEAISAYQEALAIRPESVETHVALGDAYRHLGQLDRAMAAYQSALIADPSSTIARLALVRALADSGAPGEAEAVVARLLEDAPSEEPALLALANLRLAQGDVQEAVRIASSAVEAHPKSATALAGRALILLQSGDAEGALADLDRAQALQPRSADVRLARGEVYLTLGQGSEARAQFEAAAGLAPADPRPWLALGRLEAANGSWGEAEAAYREATRREPGSAAGHVGLAGTLAAQGQWTEAERSLLRALAVEPGSAAARLALGDLYRDRGDLEAAAEQYRSYLTLVYDGTTGYLHWAGAYLAAQQPEQAEALLLEALSRYPDGAGLRAALGDAYRLQGRAGEAIQAYEAALAADPELASAHLGLGQAWLALDRPDRAREAFAQAEATARDGSEVRVQVARAYLSAGLEDDAHRAAERAVQTDAGSPEAWVVLGDVLYRKGDVPLARTQYRQALRLDPKSYGGLMGEGRCEQALGYPLSAVAALQAAAVANPTSAEPWLALAAVHQGQGLRDKARSALEEARRREPESPSVLVAFAQLALSQGELTKALAWVEQALDKAPDSASALLVHAQVNSALGQHEAALRSVQRAVALDPENASAYLTLGDVQRALGRYAEALVAYQRYEKLAPPSAAAQMKLGQAYQLNSNWEAAAAAYRRAASYDPTDPTPYVLLAQLQVQLGDPRAAEQSYRQALALRPGDPGISLGLARVLVSAGDFAGARSLVEAALAADPSSGMALLLRGDVLLGLGEMAAAEESYRRAVAAEPTLAAAYVALGNLQSARLDEPTAAVESYERALALEPRQSDLYDQLVRAYRRSVGLPSALARLQGMAQSQPQSLWVRMALGLVYQWSGQRAEALREYAAAAALAPDYAEAHRRLGHVYQEQWDFAAAEASYRRFLSLGGSGAAAEDVRARLDEMSRQQRAVQIVAPVAGQSLSGKVEVLGTAAIADFAYYKLECAPADTPGAWTVIHQSDRQVEGGVLAVWSTGTLAPGEYILRLTAVDSTGNYPPYAEVRVKVVAP
ncbi:MAG: tetratricopeptide repeat protein [Anaerolineae bacterium]|nr:tetratricopeptide repeat protein [Anaerolineae bacterium]